MRKRTATLGWGLALWAAAPAFAAVDPFERIRQATVGVGPDDCAGAVVGDPQHALTAAHCVAEGPSPLSLTLHDGRKVRAAVASIDRGRDIAIIELETPASVEPLEVANRLPQVGEELYFSGRLDRSVEQLVKVERLGRCPSLPSVPRALFTTVDGAPGDSGAPLVDHRLRVVGLVHGGAACHIATPTHEVGAMLARLEREGPGVGGAGAPPK
ncbi:MAG: trypsin-like peptidase domain-containing protein [Myxococcales bacterium]|nr:trypsin-like peptidase domain-containing protein [Myxococcales bacterium]